MVNIIATYLQYGMNFENSNITLQHCINGKCVHKNSTEVVLELPSETDSPIDYDEYPPIDFQHD